MKSSRKVNEGKKEMKGKKLYVFKHENVRMTDLTKDTQRKGKKRLGSYTMQCNAHNMHQVCRNNEVKKRRKKPVQDAIFQKVRKHRRSSPMYTNRMRSKAKTFSMILSNTYVHCSSY